MASLSLLSIIEAQRRRTMPNLPLAVALHATDICHLQKGPVDFATDGWMDGWCWPWPWPGPRGVVVSIIGVVVGFPVKLVRLWVMCTMHASTCVYVHVWQPCKDRHRSPVAGTVAAVVVVVVVAAILPPSSTPSSSSPSIPPDRVQLIQGPHRQRLVVTRAARRRQDHDHGPAVDHLPLDTAEPEPATMHCRANVDCRMSQLGGCGLSLEFLFLSHGENASSAFPTLAVAALASLLCCLDTPA